MERIDERLVVEIDVGVVLAWKCELGRTDSGRYTAGQSGGTRRKGTDQNVHLVAGEVSAVPVVSSRSRRAAGLSDIV
jgi:hypothetical protein